MGYNFIASGKWYTFICMQVLGILGIGTILRNEKHFTVGISRHILGLFLFRGIHWVAAVSFVKILFRSTSPTLVYGIKSKSCICFVDRGIKNEVSAGFACTR